MINHIEGYHIIPRSNWNLISFHDEDITDYQDESNAIYKNPFIKTEEKNKKLKMNT